MTDTTTAKLKGREVSTLGATPDLAKEMYAHKGRCYMAIIEVSVDGRHDTKNKVADLVVGSFEIAEHGSDLDKHLRDLASTVYQNRGITGGQQAIDDSLTPDLKDAIAAGQQHRPHPFLPTDAAADNPTCEVCGLAQAAAVHLERDTIADPFAAPDDEGDDVE